MGNENSYSYIKDFAPLQGKDKTLAVKAELKCITKKDIQDNPRIRLNEIHAGYSRFEISIIDKTIEGLTRTATCNLKAGSEFRAAQKEIASAAEKCRRFKQEAQTVSNDVPSSPAYTWTFKAGNLKGKSPAQVLNEQGDSGKKVLENQYNWLKENANGKFEDANKLGMNAIIEACELYNAGNLKKITNSACKVFEVFSAPVKLPKASKAQNGEYTPQTSLKIICEPGKEYPFNITIENCEVVITKYPDGRVTASNKDKEGNDIRRNVLNLSFNASYQDFEALFDKMLARMEDFETLCYPLIYKEIEQRCFKPVSNAS